MSDENQTTNENTNIPAFFINAGTVTASKFSVHFVAGNELPDGNSVPSVVMTFGTEFAEELGKQLLRAVEESRASRTKGPSLVAEK